MGNIFNTDFIEFIEALNLFKVEYVLIGGYSVIIHGYNRTTGDMDIFVRASVNNHLKLQKAFGYFGMFMGDMNLENFLDVEKNDVFVFGRPPVSIEIITKIKGPDFEEVYKSAFDFKIENNIYVKTIHINELRRAKQASNRPRDLDDLDNLKMQ